MAEFLFSDAILNELWSKASKIDGLDPETFRKDACGAAMMRDKYEDLSSEFGWTVDFIYPIERGGDDNINNLRAMQWENARSKSNDFPFYLSAKKFEGFQNVNVRRELHVNDKKLNELAGIYKFTI